MIRMLQQELTNQNRLTDENIISSYRFENNALDSIGNNDALTGYSGVGYYPNFIIGKGKDLNVSNTWLKIANNPNLGFSNGINDVEGGFSFMMEPQYASIPLSNTPYLLCKRGNTTTTNREYDLLMSPNGVIVFRLFDKDTGSSGGRIQVSCDLSTDYYQYKNYHVIIAYDGSGTAAGLKMFINGYDVGVSEEIGTYIKCWNYNTSLYVGTVSWSENNAVHRPAIAIDELRKWNIAPTPEEAMHLATQELAGIRLAG